MDKRTAPDNDVTGITPTNIDLYALVDSLTPAQRFGRACVTCGVAGTNLKPAGKLLDLDVVECDTHRFERSDADNPPTWLIGPCPDWCVAKHTASDHPDDRQHASEILGVELLTHDFENYGSSTRKEFRPISASADLIQHYREAEARVCVGIGEKASFRMTLAEAAEYATNILALVAEARGQESSTE